MRGRGGTPSESATERAARLCGTQAAGVEASVRYIMVSNQDWAFFNLLSCISPIQKYIHDSLFSVPIHSHFKFSKFKDLFPPRMHQMLLVRAVASACMVAGDPLTTIKGHLSWDIWQGSFSRSKSLPNVEAVPKCVLMWPTFVFQTSTFPNYVPFVLAVDIK